MNLLEDRQFVNDTARCKRADGGYGPLDPSAQEAPMTPFRERNKTVIGVVGVLAIVALLAGSFSLDRLVGGEEFKAEFTEAAGLRPNDEVRVAGVKVGKVLGVDLAGDRVQVKFRAKDVELGNRSRADIRIKTVLGRKFLSAHAGRRGRDGPRRGHPARAGRPRRSRSPTPSATCRRRSRRSTTSSSRSPSRRSPTPSATPRTRCAPRSRACRGCRAPSPTATTSSRRCSSAPAGSATCWPSATRT